MMSSDSKLSRSVVYFLRGVGAEGCMASSRLKIGHNKQIVKNYLLYLRLFLYHYYYLFKSAEVILVGETCTEGTPPWTPCM
jgi:hypothetical protein